MYHSKLVSSHTLMLARGLRSSVASGAAASLVLVLFACGGPAELELGSDESALIEDEDASEEAPSPGVPPAPATGVDPTPSDGTFGAPAPESASDDLEPCAIGAAAESSAFGGEAPSAGAHPPDPTLDPANAEGSGVGAPQPVSDAPGTGDLAPVPGTAANPLPCIARRDPARAASPGPSPSPPPPAAGTPAADPVIGDAEPLPSPALSANSEPTSPPEPATGE